MHTYKQTCEIIFEKTAEKIRQDKFKKGFYRKQFSKLIGL
jgi:hypothetical protein